MSDTEWLKRRLSCALPWLGLALPACDREAPAPPAAPAPATAATNPPAAPVKANATASAGSAHRSVDVHGANGKWCGPGEGAKTIGIPTGPIHNGCPKFVDGALKPDGASGELAAFPFDGFGFLDPFEAQKHRAEGKEGWCCYNWREKVPGGRPLRDGDVARLAHPARRRDWLATAPLALRAPAALRARLAQAWLDDARAEHASIASFALCVLQLLACGAPAELVAATQRAALDEVRHAQLCFALASAYAGAELGPAALPAPTAGDASLGALAESALLEGALGETTAALCARHAAADCGDAVVRGILLEIADDEADHAALAWRTLAWALEQGDAATHRRVAHAAAEARSDWLRECDDGDDDLELQGHGRLGPRRIADLRRAAWREIVEPALVHLRLEVAA